MFNLELADEIVEYLNRTFPDKVQFDELRKALPEFSEISEDEWLKSLDALNQDGRVDFKGIRTGFGNTLGMVANIVISSTERKRFATLASTTRSLSHSGLLVFISHSSKDAELALALIDYLRSALALTPDKILCSSVDGYRLPVGVNTEGKLREEVNAAKVVIGLITPSSLASYFVMFELGARWGANLFLAPLLAGVNASDLSGPLSLLNALSASNEAQLHQLVGDIGRYLSLPLQPTASYIRNINTVKALAEGVAIPSATPNVTAPTVKQKLKLTVSVEGVPPSQTLRVVANRPVQVSRVEYMLSNEATIAGEDVSVEGEKVEIPIKDELVLKVWNTPRTDRNNYDHSGPAKIGITISNDGDADQYILPVQMGAMLQNSTMFRTIVGSKTFYGNV